MDASGGNKAQNDCLSIENTVKVTLALTLA